MANEVETSEVTPLKPDPGGFAWHWVFILAVFTIAVLAFWWI